MRSTQSSMLVSLSGKLFLTVGLIAGSFSVAQARVDPRAYLSGTWSGSITTTQPACGNVAAQTSTQRRTFVMERRHGGLTLREPGTNARCRLVFSEDGLVSVPGRCRLNTIDMTLSLQPGPNATDYVFSATSDGAACASTSTGTVTRR